MKTSFYLKRPAEARTSLYCLVFHDGRRTKVYTSISIETAQWDAKEQRARTRNHPAGHAVNKEIEYVASTLAAFYSGCRAKGYVPSDADLRDCIKPAPAAPSAPALTFWQVWEEYTAKRAVSVSMRNKLRTVAKRLKGFEAKPTPPLALDGITRATLEDFAAYMTTTERLQTGTVHTYMRLFKTFLHWCVARELTANVKWKGFSPPAPPDTLKVALSRAELDALRNTPLPHEHLRNCRDLFLIGCLTGLRYSDYTRIQPQHVNGGLLTIRQQKTGDYVEVPLNAEAASLVERLTAGGIRIITNQRMNEYVKEVCRLSGIDGPIETHVFHGKAKAAKLAPKWQLIGTHTARRTFATNLLLAGIPSQVVMQYTGHGDYKSFAKYVNIPRQSQHETVRNAI